MLEHVKFYSNPIIFENFRLSERVGEEALTRGSCVAIFIKIEAFKELKKLRELNAREKKKNKIRFFDPK